MQVTAANPVSLSVSIATPVAKSQELILADEPLQPITPVSAASVSLGQTRDEPASYDQMPVNISGLRNKAQGAAASAVSQNLLSSLNMVASGKAKLGIGSIFSQIGALSRETKEFSNEARTTRVTQEAAIKNSSPDFSRQATSLGKSVALSIKTKDGDTIQITIKEKGIGRDSSSLEFSFLVDGDLSEAEQKALGQLTEKLGQMGDEFFRTDTTELRNLKGIDTNVISHFSFTLRRPDPAEGFVEHSYEFNINETTQTQTLRAQDVNGYSVDITTNLKTLTENGVADASMLKPYLDLIRAATDDASVENQSRRFMLDAFESVFAGFISAIPVLMEDKTEKTLAAFDTGLPDFQASIRSKVVHNRNFYSQASALVLNMQQQTRTETNADAQIIKQESRYELINNRFDGLPGMDNADPDAGNYRYIVEHETGSTSRVMSMTNDRVNNLWVEQDFKHEEKISDYQNFKLIDEQTNNSEDRQLQQFSEIIATLNANKQDTAINDLLEMSKQNLFIGVV